ncbi:MAG: GNAT family N-acetyltransferase [Candidatus Binatia bacterium]
MSPNVASEAPPAASPRQEGAARRGGEPARATPPVYALPVQHRRDRTRFIKVPWSVYADDPVWVPPLVVERRQHLSQRNPFFAHARAQFWVAYRQGRPVGRISAQVDDLHLERYHDATGYFGFLECIDDGPTFHTLFTAAEEWLRQQGMRRAIGPFNFSINDECGLLIDGFDTPPMFLMGHGRPYYDERVKQQGYRKAKDTVAYLLATAQSPPAVMQATVRRAGSGRIQVRPLRLAHLREDLDILRDIFNDAWSDNWNYTPFTAAELAGLGQSLKLFVPPEFVQIAEVDGIPAAMIVVVPNLNESIRDLGGHLLPFGWLRLLWRLKWAGPRTGRVPLMGVRHAYQRSSLGMALVFLLVEAVRGPVAQRGIEQMELSWTLEDNRAMRHIKERLGARLYKTYRIYEKTLV